MLQTKVEQQIKTHILC